MAIFGYNINIIFYLKFRINIICYILTQQTIYFTSMMKRILPLDASILISRFSEITPLNRFLPTTPKSPCLRHYQKLLNMLQSPRP